MMTTTLFTACRAATMASTAVPYGLVEEASIVVRDGVVHWVGATDRLPPDVSPDVVHDLHGALVTPALIDCHTHVVFGGSRASEFEQRQLGKSYADIAGEGGGILATVAATRKASDAELLASSLTRVDALLSEGVGTIEVKSGYGLTIEHELRMLRVARALATQRPVTIRTSWLAAHAVPSEYAGRSDDYIDEIVIKGLNAAHAEGLVDAVDGFCETIAFSPAQIARVFCAARALGLPVKLHAEQLSDQKGAVLAAQHQALSVDHLEYLEAHDVAQLAAGKTVAVLLPGAFYALHETRRPPVAALREHDVPIAIATDCNPGSSPLKSLLTALNMACTLFGLTPEEALTGATRHAAAALGLHGTYGVLAPGARADLAVWNVAHPAELSYWIAGNKPVACFHAGVQR